VPDDLATLAFRKDAAGHALAALPSSEALLHAIETASDDHARARAKAAWQERRDAVDALRQATLAWHQARRGS
jgi:uncharacterized membrane protein